MGLRKPGNRLRNISCQTKAQWGDVPFQNVAYQCFSEPAFAASEGSERAGEPASELLLKIDA